MEYRHLEGMRIKCYFGELDGFRKQDKISYSHMFTNHFSSSEPKDRWPGPITSQSG